MNGVVQFLRSLVMVALLLGAAGTLVEATGIVAVRPPKLTSEVALGLNGLTNSLSAVANE